MDGSSSFSAASIALFNFDTREGYWCLLFLVCALFYHQGLRPSGLRLNLDVICVPDGWWERERCLPLIISYSRLCFILRSPSQTQFVNQVPKSELLKRSHLVQAFPRGMESKTGLVMGYRAPQVLFVKSSHREWVRVVMRLSFWH